MGDREGEASHVDRVKQGRGLLGLKETEGLQYA